MYLTNYVFGEVKIDCRNEVSKNVRVLGTLTFYLLTAGATQRILEYRKNAAERRHFITPRVRKTNYSKEENRMTVGERNKNEPHRCAGNNASNHLCQSKRKQRPRCDL